METGKRFSQKREAVLNNLKSRTDHPSAAMVYDSIKEQYPNISLGTVYRNLNDLADSGKILRFASDGKDHFDGNIAPHYHFCCNECGMIYDIFDKSAIEISDTISDLIKCKIESMQIVARGKCKACLKNSTNL